MLIEKIFKSIAQNATVVLLAFVVIGLSPASARGDMLTDYYAQTSWPTLHRDSCNSDFVPFDGSDSLVTNWTALDGVRVLAAVTTGPEGNLYVTTGKGSLRFHLYAFDQNGGLIWKTNLLDSLSVLSSAVVDRDGYIYISDSEELFAFYPNGVLKWSIPISDTVYTTAITVNGYLVAITKDGQVMALNRDNGSLAAEILDLNPGPAYKVINTPAIHPVTNRIYIVTGGSEATYGYFYGIDFVQGSLGIAFETKIGSNSLTSPTISHNGSHIYVADRDKLLYAFNTDGSLAWSHPLVGQCHGSVTVGPPSLEAPNGVIYFLENTWVTAIADLGGSPKVLWDTKDEFALLADKYLSDLGYPKVVRASSIISAATNYLYIAVDLGYSFPYRGENYFIPHLTLVCTMGLYGTIIGEPVEVRDVCEGMLSLTNDGSIYVTHGSLASSIAYQLNKVLPPKLRVPKPLSGITALRPASSLSLAKNRIDSGKKNGKDALSFIKDGEVEKAAASITKGESQLRAVFAIGDTVLNEIDAKTAKQAWKLVDEAYKLFDNAKKQLYDAQAQPAALSIENANGKLEEAISILTSE